MAAFLMPDGRRRSREHWTDSMEAGPASPPAHVHRLPRSVRLALVGLLGAVFLLLVALGLMAVYVYQANQYMQGRGEFRDREAARLEEQIRRSVCDLLDQLPEGGLLERPRAKYHCGPGIPLDQLTPAERGQLTNRTASSSPTPSAQSAPPSTATPPFGSGAVLNPPRATTPPAPPRPTLPPQPTSPPGPPPLVDLEPITDPLCDALGVCA